MQSSIKHQPKQQADPESIADLNLRAQVSLDGRPLKLYLSKRKFMISNKITVQHTFYILSFARESILLASATMNLRKCKNRLILDELPKHPEYKALEHQRPLKALKMTCARAMDAVAKIKPILQREFAERKKILQEQQQKRSSSPPTTY
ncbi:hypothetical protein HDU76_006528, partial [Blyttiomyces sp. JEL0837]